MAMKTDTWFFPCSDEGERTMMTFIMDKEKKGKGIRQIIHTGFHYVVVLEYYDCDCEECV
jgi:hypothetical protein